MGALAAAGCAWSARGEPDYAGKWEGSYYYAALVNGPVLVLIKRVGI